MYIALAARPLPKWFHLILSILLFNLSCASIYVYIMTRNVTTSRERFESVPSYVVSILFFASGCLSLSMTKSVINENLRVAQIGVALSLVTIIVSMSAVICTLWLADTQDNFVVCIYHAQRSQCMCRNDNTTNSQDTNWVIYEGISGCNKLDSLNRCMIASIALSAVGAFICFLAFSNFGLIWARKKTERGDGTTSPNGHSQGHRTGSGVLTRPRTMGRNPTGLGTDPNRTQSTASTGGTPGAHSDWDGWLFSHPIFRQMFSDFRHIWFPPSYEESQRTPAVAPDPAQSTQIHQSHSTCPVGWSADLMTRSLGDYPPPPYSKSPKRKYTLKRHQPTPALVPNAGSSSCVIETVTATQSCV